MPWRCSAVLLFLAAQLHAAEWNERCRQALQEIRSTKPAPLSIRQDQGEIWLKRTSEHRFDLTLFNPGGAIISIDVVWKELGLSGAPRVRDLLKNEDRGKVRGGFAERLEPHSCSLLAIFP